MKPWVLSPLGRGLLRGLCRHGPCGLEAIPWLSVRSGPRLGPPFVPCPCSLQGVSCRKITGATRHPRETGIRVSASFPAAVGHTHWDWSSSNPALLLRGLTRERLSALDAGPHVASSACCGPLNPFGRRSADRLTRLLPAGSGLSRQDQTNLCHGAPRRSDDTEARHSQGEPATTRSVPKLVHASQQ